MSLAEKNNTAAIADVLSEFITPVYPVPREIIERLAEKSCWKKVQATDLVCQEGVPFHEVVWVADGIFRVSRIMDKKDQTIAFGVRGDPFLSPDTYLYGTESQLSYNPVVESEIISVKVKDFQELVDDTELVKWFNKVLMRQIHSLENRYIWLGQQSAYSRYQRFVKLRPDVVARIPLKYIASYLGVSQTHLSRIRAKVAGK